MLQLVPEQTISNDNTKLHQNLVKKLLLRNLVESGQRKTASETDS